MRIYIGVLTESMSRYRHSSDLPAARMTHHDLSAIGDDRYWREILTYFCINQKAILPLSFLYFFNPGEPIAVNRGPKPKLLKSKLTEWMDKQADAPPMPTTAEIKEYAEELNTNSVNVQSNAVPCRFGKIWWRLFTKQNKGFVARLAPNVERQRAAACLSPQEWATFFNDVLKAALENVGHDPFCIWNKDESGFFRGFSTVGQKV